MEAVSETVINGLKPLIDTLDSLGFIGHMTHVVKLHAVDAALQPHADALGMELTMIKVSTPLRTLSTLSRCLCLLLT